MVICICDNCPACMDDCCPQEPCKRVSLIFAVMNQISTTPHPLAFFSQSEKPEHFQSTPTTIETSPRLPQDFPKTSPRLPQDFPRTFPAPSSSTWNELAVKQPKQHILYRESWQSRFPESQTPRSWLGKLSYTRRLQARAQSDRTSCNKVPKAVPLTREQAQLVLWNPETQELA